LDIDVIVIIPGLGQKNVVGRDPVRGYFDLCVSGIVYHDVRHKEVFLLAHPMHQLKEVVGIRIVAGRVLKGQEKRLRRAIRV
jgi:hypothetical protein